LCETSTGTNRNAFHATCDGVPNTIIFIKTSNRCVCGGFAVRAWPSRNLWTSGEFRVLAQEYIRRPGDAASVAGNGDGVWFGPEFGSVVRRV
jgi:hypothetical protein